MEGRSAASAARMFAAAAAAVALSACASKGIDLDSVAVDPTITTSSTGSARPPQPDPLTVADEVAIRNAVSSANLEELRDGRLHWANPQTGSRGEINRIVEYREKGTLCRSFDVSRESFEGVAMHSADVCLAPGGEWWTRDFRSA